MSTELARLNRDSEGSFLESGAKGKFDSDNRSQVVVTEEFQRAFELIDNANPFIFITGKAGTGKSTFVELLKARLRNFALVAPTGVAALNVGAQTIHSFFRLAPGPIDFSKLGELKNNSAFKALKTLIIDEISMVRVDLLEAMELILRHNGAERDQPFGGVQIVAIGDLYQLPPVVSTQEERAFLQEHYKTPFFFAANCLKDLGVERVEFTKVFRQKEEQFIGILNSVREGRELSASVERLNERVKKIEPEFPGIILTTNNNRAAKINSDRLDAIPSAKRTYKGSIKGDIRIDHSKLPAPLELTLKVGSRVMFVKNDGDKRWVNGTLGIVTELAEQAVVVKILDTEEAISAEQGTSVRVEPQKWENVKFVYDSQLKQLVSEKVGEYAQLPLNLAWAVTIHKSQGKTFDRVHIDLDRGAFAEGQLYVALSRSRTLGGVTIEKPVDERDVRVNQDVVSFFHP